MALWHNSDYQPTVGSQRLAMVTPRHTQGRIVLQLRNQVRVQDWAKRHPSNNASNRRTSKPRLYRDTTETIHPKNMAHMATSEDQLYAVANSSRWVAYKQLARASQLGRSMQTLWKPYRRCRTCSNAMSYRPSRMDSFPSPSKDIYTTR